MAKSHTPAYQITMITNPISNLMIQSYIRLQILSHIQVNIALSCQSWLCNLFSSVDLIQEIESNSVGSPVSDFTDENFEELVEYEDNMDSMFCSNSYPAVDDPASGRYTEIARHGIVDCKGDDPLGRKIIVVYAHKLPPVKQIDHGQLLR